MKKRSLLLQHIPDEIFDRAYADFLELKSIHTGYQDSDILLLLICTERQNRLRQK